MLKYSAGLSSGHSKTVGLGLGLPEHPAAIHDAAIHPRQAVALALAGPHPQSDGVVDLWPVDPIGGGDHTGVSFTMRNAFLFAAINPPPMEAADKSRLAMLNRGKLDRMWCARR